MLVCFIIAWSPYAIVVLMGTFNYRDLIKDNVTVQTLPSLFAKLSNCYNPLIYLGLNKQVMKIEFLKRYILIYCLIVSRGSDKFI